MENYKNVKIKLTRGELCDLLLACTLIQFNDGAGEKWSKLHDKLNEQLEELDNAR